ncbi:Nuclease precursor [Piscirickettsia salmonis]|uniref:DNA/RNA non-specific endonuclease n=1 Tax=Piscirickettsia salmonis TaxID=1238 RepID=UPI0012B7E32F|nr:DNA/RNA non-specific endonuclease [Piscirickettsia salmonis]QGP49553.1 Nuclease precursor [Piscirickettsia salmonis]QGP55454.1 Nuclease precursor [Piscirickettsia salmonis]QGP58707.1 Nuclease precursor [Piscirickettsia salmonis]QGP65023.1 Nuclease precursor [Piscirickettsia salmonis]
MKIKRTMLFLCAIGVTVTAYANEKASCQQFLKYGNPGGVDQYLCREGYVVGYNYATKQPRWVAYRLTRSSVSHAFLQKEAFYADDDVPSSFRVIPKDYSKSGYSYVQFAPQASMDFNKLSLKQSFLLSNTSPQNKQLSRLAWRKLEKDVRNWTNRYGEVYVYTGPTFDGDHLKKIGNGIFVPTGFFKIIYAPKQEKALAFWVPNKKVAPRKIGLYLTTVKVIEERTGLRFLSKLNSSSQDHINIAYNKLWPSYN